MHFEGKPTRSSQWVEYGIGKQGWSKERVKVFGLGNWKVKLQSSKVEKAGGRTVFREKIRGSHLSMWMAGV